MHDDAHVPCPSELALEAVEKVGIADKVAACEHDMGQVGGTDESGCLLANVDHVLQRSEFGTVVVGR